MKTANNILLVRVPTLEASTAGNCGTISWSRWLRAFWS